MVNLRGTRLKLIYLSFHKSILILYCFRQNATKHMKFQYFDCFF